MRVAVDRCRVQELGTRVAADRMIDPARVALEPARVARVCRENLDPLEDAPRRGREKRQENDWDRHPGNLARHAGE